MFRQANHINQNRSIRSRLSFASSSISASVHHLALLSISIAGNAEFVCRVSVTHAGLWCVVVGIKQCGVSDVDSDESTESFELLSICNQMQ